MKTDESVTLRSTERRCRFDCFWIKLQKECCEREVSYAGKNSWNSSAKCGSLARLSITLTLAVLGSLEKNGVAKPAHAYDGADYSIGARGVIRQHHGMAL